MISPKELDALLKVARKHNVESLYIGELQVRLFPLPDPLPSEAQPSPAPSSDAPAADLTEEELLFYSSGGPL